MALTKKFISIQQDEYPHAYIVVTSVVCKKNEEGSARLDIFKSVEARNSGIPSLDHVFISFNYDKNSPDDAFKQAYLSAKQLEEFQLCEDV